MPQLQPRIRLSVILGCLPLGAEEIALFASVANRAMLQNSFATSN
jgi:hypothetical protein